MGDMAATDILRTTQRRQKPVVCLALPAALIIVKAKKRCRSLIRHSPKVDPSHSSSLSSQAKGSFNNYVDKIRFIFVQVQGKKCPNRRG